jgi:shikimate kinase
MGHLWLIGMMGSGKTTVGSEVAATLGVPFVDSDDVVVAATGRSIEDLFSESEDVFRIAENDAIASIAALDDRVVATGGGSVLDPLNVAVMRSTGVTVLLNTDSRTLATRLSSTQDRPLLSDGGDIATIATQRAPVYTASADVIVDTTDREIEDVVQEVAKCVDM